MLIKAVSPSALPTGYRIRRFGAVLLLAGFACAGLTAAGTSPALAQDSSSVSQQLQRLRRDITDLQRTVFAGAKPPSDAVTAAEAPSAETAQANARLQLRIQALEGEIRTLTGRLEETGFQLNSISNRLDKLVSDVDYRLQALERGGAAPGQGNLGQGNLGQGNLGQAGAGQIGAVPPANALQAPQAGAVSQSGSPGTTVITSQGSVNTQPGQNTLGQISQSQLQNSQAGLPVAPATNQPQVATAQPAPPPAPPTAAPGPAPVNAARPEAGTAVTLPPGSEKEQYQYAYNLLRQDLDQAEAAFKAFLEEHPNGPFTGNAMYWLGETHYARSNFRDAAAVFVDAYTNFPTGPKASASLLKLGMSLGALGKKDAACASFSELKVKYPDSDARVLERADAEAGKIGCP